jgi:hypothetical protein
MNSSVSTIDDHDYRHDLDERRREAERSRSRSTSSHNSSIKEYNIQSPNNNRYRQQRHRRNEYQHERKRSSDQSYHYHQRNLDESNSPHLQSTTRHQRFNYNHQSVANHPRFANVNTIPSPTKSLNYNSFDTYNYPKSIADYSNTSSMTSASQK